MTKHFRSLEQMYVNAPINAHFRPSITVSEGEAVVRMAVRSDMHHAAHAADLGRVPGLVERLPVRGAGRLDRELLVGILAAVLARMRACDTLGPLASDLRQA